MASCVSVLYKGFNASERKLPLPGAGLQQSWEQDISTNICSVCVWGSSKSTIQFLVFRSNVGELFRSLGI
jgi:hypothetical protein